MKSYIAKAQEVEKKWFVVDAAGKPLGRVASQVASILRGKHKPTFTPNVDCGDHVIVINAELAFEEAVRRMLPSGVLGRKQLKNLVVYRGAEHNHEAQKPEVLELKY